jgi:hypothetical protein
MARSARGEGQEDIGDLKARVERLELEVREWDAKARIIELRVRLEQLKAAHPRPRKVS